MGEAWNRWVAMVRREYVTRVRRRVFLVSTVLGPLLMVGFVAGMVMLTQSTEEPVRVWVADESGVLTVKHPEGGWMPSCPSCFPSRDLLSYEFGRTFLSEEALKEAGFSCMISLDDGVVQSEKVQLLQLAVPSMRIKRWMEGDLSEAIERLKVRDMPSLDYDAYLGLKTEVRLVGLDYATGEVQSDGKAVVGFIFSLLMFMFVMIYGMHVMRGVIEEKANRIVEVILSTVKPMHLLSAKIVGIGAVGLTQMVAWSLLGWLFMGLFGWGVEQSDWIGTWAMTQGLSDQAVDFQTVLAQQEELAFLLDIHWPTMVLFGLVYFALGYALYGALFACIGSMVEAESDAQYLMLPVMLPLIFSYSMAAQAIDAPESTVAVVSSLVPFSAPVSMMVRLPMGVPWWHVAVSLGLLVLTTLAILALAGRVYRVAILMYGKRLGLMDVLKWMVQPNGSSR